MKPMTKAVCNRPDRRSCAGFTLIEISMVLILLGVLAAIAVPQYLDLQNEAFQKAALSAVSEAQSRLNSTFSQRLLEGRSCAESLAALKLKQVSDNPSVSQQFGELILSTSGSGVSDLDVSSESPQSEVMIYASSDSVSFVQVAPIVLPICQDTVSASASSSTGQVNEALKTKLTAMTSFIDSIYDQLKELGKNGKSRFQFTVDGGKTYDFEVNGGCYYGMDSGLPSDCSTQMNNLLKEVTGQDIAYWRLETGYFSPATATDKYTNYTGLWGVGSQSSNAIAWRKENNGNHDFRYLLFSDQAITQDDKTNASNALNASTAPNQKAFIQYDMVNHTYAVVTRDIKPIGKDLRVNDEEFSMTIESYSSLDEALLAYQQKISQ